MSNHSDDELFSRYRDELGLGPEGRARAFRKLRERFAAGEQPSVETNVAPPQLPQVRGLWGAQVGLATAVLGVGAALLWANLDGLPPPPPAPKPERVQVVVPAPQLSIADDEPELRPAESAAAKTTARLSGVRGGVPQRPQPARVAAAPRALPAPESPPAAEIVEAPPPQPPAAPSQSTAAHGKALAPERSDRPRVSSTLGQEVQLLQAAQLALRTGETRRALALLAEHTWTYPNGQLAEARDVARIIALCQSGDVTQSQAHAKRFLEQRPQSPYALRVKTGCSAVTDSAVVPERSPEKVPSQ